MWSKLKIFNYFFLQWFFVRLEIIAQIMADHHLKVTLRNKYFSLIGFIVPMTGWDGNYIVVGKKIHHFFRFKINGKEYDKKTPQQAVMSFKTFEEKPQIKRGRIFNEDDKQI